MPLDTTLTAPDRRGLLRGAGLGAAALGTLAVAGRSTPAQAATAPSIPDVLNFALNLEYLEAEFYLRATTGNGIPQEYLGGTGTQGITSGGARVPFVTPRIARIAMDIASDEFAHVKFLRSALGSAAVAHPRIDLKNSFTILARAAGIVGPNGKFDPFADEMSFLLGAFIFEDVGVSAYSGAAGYLTGSLPVLAAAAGILAVEAYHGGAIRAQLVAAGTGIGVMANKIAALRATLSGAADDVGPINPGSGTTPTSVNISDSDANSIAFARTPGQVLNVVYGNASAKPGLFFPNGLNGAVS